MPSTRRSLKRAKSQPRYGTLPLDNSPPRRSSSTVRPQSYSHAFKVIKMMLDTFHCGSNMPSGTARLSPEGNELLQLILTKLRMRDGFSAWERRHKLTYNPRQRTLTYTPPSLIIEQLASGFHHGVMERIGVISQDFLTRRGGGDYFIVTKHLMALPKPWPVLLHGTDKEAYIDRVWLFDCPAQPGDLEFTECFGIEASFPCQHRDVKRKVGDLMVANGGNPGMVIVFRIGYDSEATYEASATDPDAVAALNREADFTVIQVVEKADGSGLRLDHPVKNRIFRHANGLPIEGHLEFTVGDMIGVVSGERLPDSPYTEQILQQKVVIPFSDMAHWIEQGEDWVRRRKLPRRPPGSSVPKRSSALQQLEFGSGQKSHV